MRRFLSIPVVLGGVAIVLWRLNGMVLPFETISNTGIAVLMLAAWWLSGKIVAHR